MQKKNEREILIRGERESDFLLFKHSKWIESSFDKSIITDCITETIVQDSSDIMLIGHTYTRMSPECVEYLKRASRITNVRYRGGNRYDLRFIDSKAKENASINGYVQAGGVVLKTSEWKKTNLLLRANNI